MENYGTHGLAKDLTMNLMDLLLNIYIYMARSIVDERWTRGFTIVYSTCESSGFIATLWELVTERTGKIHHFSLEKSSVNGDCPYIAMLIYQRVT